MNWAYAGLAFYWVVTAFAMAIALSESPTGDVKRWHWAVLPLFGPITVPATLLYKWMT